MELTGAASDQVKQVLSFIDILELQLVYHNVVAP